MKEFKKLDLNYSPGWRHINNGYSEFTSRRGPSRPTAHRDGAIEPGAWGGAV